MSDGEPISLKVVEKVADREGTDPAALHPPLHTAIDTEALDALFRSISNTTRANGTVTFHYQGYTVRVDGSGEIRIDETISFTESAEPSMQPAEDPVGD